jgi:hypothetical protein
MVRFVMITIYNNKLMQIGPGYLQYRKFSHVPRGVCAFRINYILVAARPMLPTAGARNHIRFKIYICHILGFASVYRAMVVELKK